MPSTRLIKKFIGFMWLCAGILFTWLIWLAIPTSPVQASELLQSTEEQCLSCHANPDMKVTLPSGEELPLTVSQEKTENSVHFKAGIECVACHTAFRDEHPKLTAQNRRELSRSYYEACQKCHPANYEKTLDSMHTTAAEAGNLEAPICTDCHGYHDVQSPNEPRSLVSTTCSKCHEEIGDVYVQSVHGSALLEEGNPDVPVCTDCHGVHNIQDARTAQFRIESPDLCASCHADAELMGKYGLSADVYNLYNLSWHGVNVSVQKAQWPTIPHESAVCSDCHGVHNIFKTDDPNSLVNPANLHTTCQKCHPGVGPNWTAAWTGHNKIDPQRTPILYYTEIFYDRFATTVLWACFLYVLLQIVHAIVGRVRRSL